MNLNYRYITDQKTVDKLPKILEGKQILQIDSETTGLHFKIHKLLLFQIGTPDEQWVIDMRECNIECLRPLLEDRNILKIFQNALFDLCFIKEHTGIFIQGVYDTMLAEIVIRGSDKFKVSLLDNLERYEIVTLDKTIVTTFIGMGDDQIFTEEQLKYAAMDVIYLEELAKRQAGQMKHTPAIRKIVRMENRLVEVTAKMRLIGVRFDSDHWLELAEESEIIYNEALSLLPDGPLWTSPSQVKRYFLNEHGIHITSYSEFPKMHGKHPILDQFITVRGLYQNVKLYGKKWFEIKLGRKAPIEIAPTIIDGRVHANFRQIIATGRFSCSQPNLQQIPKLGEYRSCFLADPGKLMVLADYSGQEIAIAAIASQEPVWLKLLREDGDIHGDMAKNMFGPDYTKEQRGTAKTVNFGILYGGGAGTIAKSAGVTMYEARQYINSFRSTVPTLHKWLVSKGKLGDKTKVSYTLYGRRRSFQYDRFSSYTRAMNTPIQGTGADIMKLALVYIDEFIIDNEYPADILLTVHDETITQVPEELAGEWAEILSKLMEKASTEILGENIIKAEAIIADRWTK